MSTGEVLVARAAMKPLATLNRPGARHRRRRHQGGDGQLQGAHRRHRRAGHGRRGRDDGGPRAGRRGVAQVRRRLGRRSSAATTPPSSRRLARLVTVHVALVGLMGVGQDDRRPPGRQAARPARSSTPTRRSSPATAAPSPRCSPPTARPASARLEAELLAELLAVADAARARRRRRRRARPRATAAGCARRDVLVVWLHGRARRSWRRGREPKADRSAARRRRPRRRCSSASTPSATRWYREVADDVLDVGVVPRVGLAAEAGAGRAHRRARAHGGRRRREDRHASPLGDRSYDVARRRRRRRLPARRPAGRARSGPRSSPRPASASTSTPASPHEIFADRRRRGGQDARHRRGPVLGVGRWGLTRGDVVVGRRRRRRHRHRRVRRRRLPPRRRRSCTCRRRCSAWSTPPSAARPA